MELTLSNGVVLAVKAGNPMTIAEIQRESELLAPKPPVWFNEAKGREEENPSDPEYKDALAQHRAEGIGRVTDAMFATSVTIVSIPDDVPGPDSSDFEDMLTMIIRRPLPTSALMRRVMWLKYIAAAQHHDLIELMAATLRATGIAEGDVSTAVARFRGNGERGADPGSGATGDGGDGGDVRALTPGTGAEVRGTISDGPERVQPNGVGRPAVAPESGTGSVPEGTPFS